MNQQVEDAIGGYDDSPTMKEAVALLIRCRDSLLVASDKRVTSREINEFINRVKYDPRD